jgi:hypothetical protein
MGIITSVGLRISLRWDTILAIAFIILTWVTLALRFYFADHDYDDPADFKKLANSPRDFTAYLVRLGDDFAKQVRRIR